ncbi:MAG: NTP transferase domain-containing protein [Bacteroidales bacterium]|jgi:molybdenum cofactor cytidylyltransferase|nr:NTP transferase domain-containing protein [Bacteroidales bacterium]
MIPVSALIPAAGKSDRMGSEKALLPFLNGSTFAGHLINTYLDFGCKPIVLVHNERLDLSQIKSGFFVTVINENQERGRSWSIHLGLQQIPEGLACFLQNIDNPFVQPDLLNEMIEKVTPDGYVLPVFQGRGGHPVLLGHKAASFFRNRERIGDFRESLKNFERQEVRSSSDKILWNINTREDYRNVMLNF